MPSGTHSEEGLRIFTRFSTWRMPAGAALLACAMLAACSKSYNSSPVPSGSATPIATPTAVATGQTPAPSTAGIAYVPDGANGGQAGIDVIHFISITGVPYAYPQQMIAFPRPVRAIAISPDGTAAVAAEGVPGAFHFLQAFLGASQGNLVPGGSAYDAAVPPATPTPIPSSTFKPTPAPSDAVVPDITGVATFGNGIQGVGLALGPDAGGLPDGSKGGILGVNQLFDQTPAFAGYAEFSGGPLSIPHQPRANLAVASPSYGSGKFAMLARGPNDLIALSITPTANGTVYIIQPLAYDGGTLGTNRHVLQGHGDMQFSPLDGGRAVLAQTTNSATGITLLTGLPTKITATPPVNLTGSTVANSVSVSPAGVFAAIGSDTGIYIFKGVNATALTAVLQNGKSGPYSPNYYGPDGLKHPLANVSSVGFTTDGNYLVALANTTPGSPGGGLTSSVVIMPFNLTTGLVAAPVLATNLTAFGAPATTQDFMIVR